MHLCAQMLHLFLPSFLPFWPDGRSLLLVRRAGSDLIKAIPTILLYTLDGKEIGRVIENPSIKPTLEEEILCLIESQ